MFYQVKTIRLDEMGREVAEWHGTKEKPVNLAETVAAIDANYPHSLIEARYVR